MTSYTDQKTKNLKTHLNNCERAEIFRVFRFKYVGKSHICWGDSPWAPLATLVGLMQVGAIPPSPPPPTLGYASGAHATEIICSRAKRAAKTEIGCIN